MDRMRVYVLFHSDIEDDKYVRGVFASREIAEQNASMDEQRGPDYVRSHRIDCCYVDEWDVATETLPVQHGPDKMYARAVDPLDRLISDRMIALIMENLSREPRVVGLVRKT